MLSFLSGSTWTTFASSCTELARYGVRYPGEYYIEPDVTVGSIKVTCFHMRKYGPLSVYLRQKLGFSLIVFNIIMETYPFKSDPRFSPNI